MIHQGTNRPINESSTIGPCSDWRTGRTYACMNERIKLSITEPINQRKSGAIDGPSTEAPIESIDEWVGARSSQRNALQNNTAQYNAII